MDEWFKEISDVQPQNVQVSDAQSTEQRKSSNVQSAKQSEDIFSFFMVDSHNNVIVETSSRRTRRPQEVQLVENDESSVQQTTDDAAAVASLELPFERS